jgi:hypothetical protein
VTPQPYHNILEPWSHPGFRPPVTLAKRERLRQFLIDRYGGRFDRVAFTRLFGPTPSTSELPSKPKRKRKPSLDRVRKQAAKAGLVVASYTINPDGSITVVPGQPDTTTNNPWDEVLPP